MDNDKVISKLNDLIEICRDGQQGFKEASENAENPDLKSFFNQASQQRAQFAGELQQEVRGLGGDPETSGSATGAAHRAWINIKGTLTGKDDHSILNEVERGEDSAVETYQEVLKDGLPTNILTIVERQFRSIKQSHDRVKQLRDAKSATSGK